MTVEKRYAFADVVFALRGEIKIENETRYAAFETAREPDFTYVIEEADVAGGRVELKREGSILRARMSTTDGLISLPRFLSEAGAAHLLIEHGAFILHASHILTPCGSILVSAPSGTGKSTLAERYERLCGTVTANEDRAIVRRVGGTWRAYGCWATGSGDKCEAADAPIRAVIMLRRGETNAVSVPRASEVLRRIIPQCTFNAADVRSRVAVIELVSSMIGEARIVDYACVNEDSALYALERYLNEG